MIYTTLYIIVREPRRKPKIQVSNFLMKLWFSQGLADGIFGK